MKAEIHKNVDNCSSSEPGESTLAASHMCSSSVWTTFKDSVISFLSIALQDYLSPGNYCELQSTDNILS
jgi:hypothetical protein